MNLQRRHLRRGGVSVGIIVAVGSMAVAAALVVGLMLLDDDRAEGATSLRLFCAAGIKKPVEQLAEAYTEAYGVDVIIQYAGSGTLLSQLTVDAEAADLYLAADMTYIEAARDADLVAEALPLAEQRPVIAVAAGNPLGIASIDDLLDGEVRLGVCNPEAASVGRTTKTALERSGDWTRLREEVLVLKPTVTDLANDLRLGALDAAILWDATVAQYDDLDLVRVPELDTALKAIAIGVTTSTDRPQTALGFARFLGSRDRGAPVFESFGYEPSRGDVWSESPKLLLYAGSMFNQAIEDTVAAFERREGVEITRVYNGCGVLVAQIRAGERPDAYFSCDVEFMDHVGELFLDPVDVSENELVIAVAAGNPLDVRTPADLARDGLRVGLAHPEKSALGHLTTTLLQHLGCAESIAASGNVVQDAPQGDFLVNALRVDGIDAAIVYRSNLAASLEDLDAVDIDADGAVARQPYAVARDTAHRLTMERLLDALTAAASRARFDELGFRWVATP